MEAEFYVAALEDALARHDKPDIFNTDQRSEFIGAALQPRSATNGIAISMDGEGVDSGFEERLWRNVKYAQERLRAYDSVSDACAIPQRPATTFEP